MKRPHSIYVASLKFAPVMKTHSFAFGSEAASHIGLPVRYLFSSGYAQMLRPEEQNLDIRYVTRSTGSTSMIHDTLHQLASGARSFRKIFEEAPPEVLFISNPHPLNMVLARMARKANPKATIIIHVHEPAASGVHSFWMNRYYAMVQLFQRAAIRRSDAVVVSSAKAHSTFRSACPDFSGHLAEVPLLYQDFACTENLERKFFTYIGKIHPRRGIVPFLAFLRHSAANGLPFRFQIASRDPLDAYLKDLTEKERDLLHLVNKPFISDAEISKALRESIACCILYDFDIMQSGVPAVAFMNGTPVITTCVDSFREIIRSGENGILLPTLHPDPTELAKAAEAISSHLETMSTIARRDFETSFSQKGWNRHYAWLMDRIGTDQTTTERKGNG